MWKINELLPTLVTNEIESVIIEEVKCIVTEQIDTAMQYFMPRPVSCECTSKVESLEQQLAETKHQLVTMTKQTEQIPRPFCEESLVNHEFTKFYTGLPNAEVVKAVFAHVSKTMPSDGITKLSPFQEFMCVLLKLRLNSPVEDLAYRFGISTSTVSRIILTWLKQMDIRMHNLIVWPDREALQKTMPACFQASFGKK